MKSARKSHLAGLFIICLIALILSGTSSFGQDFLDIQSDVRSRGLGEVGAALPDNPMGFLFNPACLSEANIAFGRFSHAQWQPAIGYHDYETYAVAAGFSLGPWINVGAALQRVNWGARSLYSEWGSLIGHYYPYDYTAYIGYAASPVPWISAGVNVKYIRIAVGKHTSKYYSADGVGFDIGIVFKDLLPERADTGQDDDDRQPSGKFAKFIEAQSHPRSRGFLFSIALLNIGAKIKSEEAGKDYPLPHSLRMGFSYQSADSGPVGVLVAADINYFFVDTIQMMEKDIDYHFGTEVNLLRLITLRGGYVFTINDSPDYATIGASLGVDRAHIDMSYIPKGDKAGHLAETFFWGLTVNW